MLDVEQGVGVAQRRVVDPRQVPDVVRREPERQRDERPEERKAGGARGDVARHREEEQRRRPLREHDVLEQVRPEERVVRERLELGDEGREDESTPAAAERDASADAVSRGRTTQQRERGGRKADRLGRRIHPATVTSVSPV